MEKVICYVGVVKRDDFCQSKNCSYHWSSEQLVSGTYNVSILEWGEEIARAHSRFSKDQIRFSLMRELSFYD
jgi:hypothetical protein